MKIVIIGAGAMGCLYGAYLSRNHEVIMLDSFDKQVVSLPVLNFLKMPAKNFRF